MKSSQISVSGFIRPSVACQLARALAIVSIMMLGVSPASALGNLVVNPGNEAALAAGPAGWTLERGLAWTQGASNPAPYEGSSYFDAGAQGGDSEISQTLALGDVAGQKFELSARLRSFDSHDASRIILEFLDADGAAQSSYDSGDHTDPSNWKLIRSIEVAPPGTTHARIRLLAQKDSQNGNNHGGYFDSISLRRLAAWNFADAVNHFYPSGFIAKENDPNNAVGVARNASVTLGVGGLIEFSFAENCLSNSGNADDDILVYETGVDVEDAYVAIRPDSQTESLLEPGYVVDGNGLYEIGKVFGGASSIDIDEYFVGYGPGVLCFNAVVLTDDLFQGDLTGTSPGADIDAVEALFAIDADGDGRLYAEDNCFTISNADQYDADLDGFGNVCDSDVDNSGVTGLDDFASELAAFGLSLGVFDFDGDGTVDNDDVNLSLISIGKAPGPSGLSCAGLLGSCR